MLVMVAHAFDPRIQEHQKFEVTLGYILYLILVWVTQDPISKKKVNLRP